MITKVAGGIIGIGLVGTGSIAMAKPHWLGMDYMPEHKPLSGEEGFSGAYGSDKFGNKYGKYLASVKKENKSWWDWAYRRLSREEIKEGKFTNKGSADAIKVSKPYADKNTEDDNAKALNQVCKAAYETNDSNGFETGTGTDKFKKTDVWKYCSPGVTFVSTVDYANNTIGNDSGNAPKLISVKDSFNDWFWKIRNEDFWSTTGANNNWSGSKAAGDSTKKSIFKTEYETNNSNDKKQTIKDLCGKAYGANKETNTTDHNKDDALKFCVLEAPAS